MPAQDSLKENNSPVSSTAWNGEDQFLPLEVEAAEIKRELETAPLGVLAVSSGMACLLMTMMVILAETTLVEARGFSGPAVFFPLAALLLLIGTPQPALGLYTLLIAALLFGASYRMAVYGSWWLVGVCIWLLAAFTLSIRHRTPFVLRTILFAFETFWGGWGYFAALHHRIRHSVVPQRVGRKAPAIYSVGIPFLVLMIGTFLLLLWRADWRTTADFQIYIDSAVTGIQRFSMKQPVIWLGVAWLTAGLLRPVAPRADERPVHGDADERGGKQKTPFFAVHRNVLIAATMVLGGFVVVEWSPPTVPSTLLNQEFIPAGYRGLLLIGSSLVVTTLLISMSFGGTSFHDSRIGQLKLLSLLNLALNFVLTWHVFRGLSVDLKLDGVNRLSMVALLTNGAIGVCFLVLAFEVFVLHRTRWVLRRFCWTFAFGVYLFFVLPVDTLVHDHNVREVLTGNTAPLVQITGSTIPDETLPVLLPLCQSDAEVIRNGAIAILTGRLEQLSADHAEMKLWGWTAVQWGVSTAYVALDEFHRSQQLQMSPGEQLVAMDRLEQLVRQQKRTAYELH